MTRSITVTSGQSMSDLLNALKIAAGDDLIIDIPADTSVLLTANEFRALSIAAERDDVEISIYTEDPLRRQLATLFGVPIVNEIPEPEPYTMPEPEFEPESISGESEDGNGFDEPAFAQQQQPIRPGRGAGGAIGKLLAGLIALAALMAIGLGLFWFFFSSMTVDLHLTRQPVASTLAYRVTDPGIAVESAPGDGIVIQGQPVQFSLSHSISAPSTGQTIIPDKAATGDLVLRNSSDTPITIAKGTNFEGFTGVEFTFIDDVEVPAAVDGQPGEAIGEIASPSGGEAGNQDIGMLTGQLENGVYYSNRMEPISGGTQKIVTTVSQGDLDQLRIEIDRELLALAATTKLDNGLLLVPSTIQIVSDANSTTPGTDGYTFSQPVGAEADEVSVTATISYSATAYDSTALTAAAIPQLEREAAGGQEFDPNSVQISAPAVTNNADGVISLLATVSGDVIPELDEQMKKALADQLAGTQPDEVDRIVSTLDYADGATVTYSPSWLPRRVPSSTGRITIVTN